MCMICRKNPCDSRCPNVQEPRALCRCEYCREGITEGEEYVDVDGEYYHLECLADMRTKELVELMGYQVQEAEERIPEYEERYYRASGY